MLKDITTGNDGSYSLTKVLALIVILALCVEHVYLTMHTGQAQPWNWSEIAAVLGSLAAALGHAHVDDPPPAVPLATPVPTP